MMKEGCCPICGSDLDYDECIHEGIEMGYEWTCQNCKATGVEWYKISFLEHGNVQKETGEDVEFFCRGTGFRQLTLPMRRIRRGNKGSGRLGQGTLATPQYTPLGAAVNMGNLAGITAALLYGRIAWLPAVDIDSFPPRRPWAAAASATRYLTFAAKEICMKLVTKEIEELFEKYPYLTQEGKGKDAKVLVKYFNPCGSGTWLITEADREGDDWLLFGYMHIFEWEWGTVRLSEMQELRLPFGLGIERDLYLPKDATVRDCAD